MLLAESDVLIVGAGVVGLAHAVECSLRGLTVTVIDRDERAVGASVRNFGHACVTAQSGELLDLALAARERWLYLSREAGFFSVESGALAVARTAEEVAVLEELEASRDGEQVRMVGADHVREALSSDARVLAGAVLRDDVRVNPREAVGAIAAWLATREGVRFVWRTSFLGAEGGVARTTRGEIRATRTIVCVGHDLDYLYPDVADAHEVRRCGLQMALVAPPGHGTPGARRICPAILTGTSMLRYPAFSETDAAVALRERLAADDPALLDIDANVMFTQRPDGLLFVGDSHRHGTTMDAFNAESTWETLLDRIAELLGVAGLRVVERWQGVYASSPRHPYLVEQIGEAVTAVSVTSGVGMTISHGLAQKVVASLS